MSQTRLSLAACVAIASQAHARLSAAAAVEHRDRVLPRGIRPLLHDVAARGDRRARRGHAHGLVANRTRLSRVHLPPSDLRRAARVPLLHSAAARRLALLLGVDGRVRGGPRQDRRRSQLQRLHRGNAQRLLHAALPDPATGACPAGTVPVYRLWNQRADSNHRYTTDPGIKAYMQSQELHRRRLRSRCRRDVHARRRCSSTRWCRRPARRRSRPAATACRASGPCTSTRKSSRPSQSIPRIRTT